EAAVALDARHLLEPPVALAEALGVRGLARDAVEVAVAVVGPAVVEAEIGARIALGLAAHHRAAMAAGVQGDADRVPAVATDDHGAPAHRARLEVARGAHLGLVPGVDPADVEDARALELEDRGIDHGRAVDLEVERRGIAADEGTVVHVCRS